VLALLPIGVVLGAQDRSLVTFGADENEISSVSSWATEAGLPTVKRTHVISLDEQESRSPSLLPESVGITP